VQKIFVSYSHADSALVAPVVRLLRAARSFVFLDVDSIEPASKWQDVIQTAIGDADLVVVFWCFHSSGSPEVEREWTAAIGLNKPLLPVLLDATPVLPPISGFQWIDFKELGETRHPAPASGGLRPAGAPGPTRRSGIALPALAAAAILCVSLVGGLWHVWFSLRSAGPPPPASTTLVAAASPVPPRVPVTPEESPGPLATPKPAATRPPDEGDASVPSLPSWLGVSVVLALIAIARVVSVRTRRLVAPSERARSDVAAGDSTVAVETRMADAIHSELVRRFAPDDRG
jgi:hypothetical protein